jgi:hypothetical protein
VSGNQEEIIMTSKKVSLPTEGRSSKEVVEAGFQ